MRRRTAVVVALAPLFGCTTSASYREKVADPTKDWHYGKRVWTSTKDTFNDFWDIFGANLSIGHGAWVNAQATKVVRAGGGYFDGQRRGLVRPRSFGVMSERRGEGGLSIFYWRDLRRQPVWGTRTLFAEGTAFRGFDIDHQNEDGHWTEFEGGFHLIGLGFQGTVRPWEVYDFFASVLDLVYYAVGDPIVHGVFGQEIPEADPSEDNARARMRKEGSDPAGYIHQPDSPFFERPRDASLGQPIEGPG